MNGAIAWFARNSVAANVLMALLVVGAFFVFDQSQSTQASNVASVQAEHAKSGPAVTPTTVNGNDQPDQFCSGDAIFSVGQSGGSASHMIDGTLVTLNVTVIGKTIDFTVTNGLVDSIVVKGGPNYNVYDYLGSLSLGIPSTNLGHGVPHDDGLPSPPTNQGNQPGMSHINACLEPLGDVKVEKTPDSEGTPPGTISAGEDAVFTITVTNLGPGASNTVTISDNLPNSGLNWGFGGGANDGDCTIMGSVGSQVLDCDFGSISFPSNATRTVKLSATTDAADCGTINNTVTITAGGGIETNNDSDTGDIVVQCPNISVVKTPDSETGAPGTIDAGQTAKFTITVSNAGPGTAFGVTLDDTLPGSGWSISNPPMHTFDTCVVPGDVLDCDIASLASGANASVTVQRATTARDCDLIDNPLTTADASNDDPVFDSGDIVVRCGAIRILKQSTKTGNPLVSNAGAVFGVTGPSNFSVTDTIDMTLNDEDITIGEVCVSGLEPGNYTVNETTPPMGYGDASQTNVVVVAVGGTDCSGSQPSGSGEIAFTNPPLMDIQLNVRDAGSNETSITSIECVSNLGTSLTFTFDGTPVSTWDTSQTHSGVPAPDTITCVLVLDP